jgi:hypothetical protein
MSTPSHADAKGLASRFFDAVDRRDPADTAAALREIAQVSPEAAKTAVQVVTGHQSSGNGSN